MLVDNNTGPKLRIIVYNSVDYGGLQIVDELIYIIVYIAVYNKNSVHYDVNYAVEISSSTLLYYINSILYPD